MSDQRDRTAERLREAFQSHENLAPPPLPVHDRVEELARGYRLRRRGLQTVGGVMAGAGLVAGVVAVSGVLPGGSKQEVRVQSVAAAPLTAAPTPTPSATDDPDPLYDFFAAGYDYQDAVKLARIWNQGDDDDSIAAVKAEAAAKLKAGETLPVKPSGEPFAPVDVKKDHEVDAFFNAGYDYKDAEKLAQLWNLPDPYSAKVKGGQEIQAGQSLPIAP